MTCPCRVYKIIPIDIDTPYTTQIRSHRDVSCVCITKNGQNNTLNVYVAVIYEQIIITIIITYNINLHVV